MREKSATAEADTDAAEQQPAQDTAEPEPQSTSGEALNFNVENVEISNASVHYNDLSTGQSVTLEDFTVTASDITLGSEFPLDIRFRVETSQPQFAVDGSIKARIQANQELNEFAVSGLNAVFDMSGEPFGGESVTAELAGSLAANLENETASLSDFSASLANLSLNTNLNVKGFGDKPALEGRIEISEFSLKELLNNLGQPAIETTDPEVLKALARRPRAPLALLAAAAHGARGDARPRHAAPRLAVRDARFGVLPPLGREARAAAQDRRVALSGRRRPGRRAPHPNHLLRRDAPAHRGDGPRLGGGERGRGSLR